MEEAITRHSLAVRISGLPAEQIKQAVLRWLDAEEGGLADLEQNLRRAEEGDREESPLSPIEKAAALLNSSSNTNMYFTFFMMRYFKIIAFKLYYLVDDKSIVTCTLSFIICKG